MAEISNLVACDRALGKHLADCEWSSRLKDLADFNDRPTAEKIFRGDNEDIELFLQKLAKSIPTQVKLPIIGYFRGIGLTIDMEDPEPFSVNLETTNGQRAYNIEYANYTFNYNVCIIGHGAASIHEIGLPLHRYFHLNPVFNCKYRLFYDSEENRAAKFNLPALIMEPRNIGFDDVTPKKDNITQIFAANAAYSVKIPMIWADQVAPDDTEVEFLSIIAGY